MQVGAAVARDRDLPPHNKFIYLLDRRYDTFGLFDLDKVSGVIRTREVLDRERQSVYNLVVIARSLNKPQLSSSAHVQIEVSVSLSSLACLNPLTPTVAIWV